jgi:hypothetical protein
LNNLNSIDGIVLGSSTLRYGLSMDSINKNLHQTWVNLAMDARDPVVCFLLLKKTLSTHNPKIVVMGLDPWIYSKYYYRHRSEIMYFDFNFEEKIYFGFEKKNLPFVLARNMINTSRNAFNEEKTPPKPTPKGLGSIELKRSAVNFKEVNDDWFKLNRYNWSELQFEYLKKINELCKQKKLRIVYVITPKRLDYIKSIKSNFLDEHTIWWNKIISRIPKEEVLGTYDCLEEFNQDSIFAEAYHLNGFGQKCFSQYIIHNLSKTNRIKSDFNFLEGNP